MGLGASGLDALDHGHHGHHGPWTSHGPWSLDHGFIVHGPWPTDMDLEASGLLQKTSRLYPARLTLRPNPKHQPIPRGCDPKSCRDRQNLLLRTFFLVPGGYILGSFVCDFSMKNTYTPRPAFCDPGGYVRFLGKFMKIPIHQDRFFPPRKVAPTGKKLCGGMFWNQVETMESSERNDKGE